MDSFGIRFKKLRVNKGLTQEELIREFNERYGYSFSKTTISQYENDKRIPEMKTLKKFVEYFGVSLDYLLCIDISLIRELGSQYKFDNIIEVKELIELLKGLIDTDILRDNNKSLTNEKKIILTNCFDIAYELIKREK
ncbi:MAG: helix-turn-helix domain-containing protein [Clostridium sp.]